MFVWGDHDALIKDVREWAPSVGIDVMVVGGKAYPNERVTFVWAGYCEGVVSDDCDWTGERVHADAKILNRGGGGCR